ncbi:unnamed protein product [Lupinus luteus]|uniref:Uncharacterized protein n=1 Tax=Lupinus luteus TaxID=3873 RepID=A0AAV1VU56_LUPLU
MITGSLGLCDVIKKQIKTGQYVACGEPEIDAQCSSLHRTSRTISSTVSDSYFFGTT